MIMKKVLLFMLMMCTAMFTFTACSSDDGEDEAKSPVSNVTVPSTAKVGSTMTIQGSGFNASGITLSLVGSDKAKTQLSGQFLSSGATVTVPMTLSTGSYSVVLTQNGTDFTLGNVTLTEPDNPISSPALTTETIAPSKAATITGSGFADGDLISLKQGDKTLTASHPTLNADGSLSFNAPDCSEGDYTLVLTRGNYSWDLMTVTVEKVRRVKSVNITVELMQFNSTFTFEYDDNNRVTKILSDGSDYATIDYDKGTITGPVPSGGENPLTMTIENGRVTSSSVYDYFANMDVPYDWKYDSDGCLKAIGDNEVAFTNGNMTAFTSLYKFGYGTEKVYSNTFNPTIAMLIADLMGSRDDILIAAMCNLTGKSSVNVPNQIVLVGQYSEDGENYTDWELPITVSSTTNKLQLTYMYMGMAEAVITIDYEEK